jgi:Protein of unknown function (DUF2838)
VFGLVAGPLTWSIVALRNSLVLHSLDQVLTQPVVYIRHDVIIFDGRLVLIAASWWCITLLDASDATCMYAVQMTSLFMHASPALVVWALRWTRAPSVIDAASLLPAEAAKFSYATFAELVCCSMTMYSAWAALYYLKVAAVRSFSRMHSCSSSGFGTCCASGTLYMPPVQFLWFHALTAGVRHFSV